jgi:hypothetical protein
MKTGSKQLMVIGKGLILALCVCILTAYCLLPTAILRAAEDSNKYTLLEPLPLGPGGTPETQADLSTYLSDIYRLLIILALALAVFQLIRGGFMYITSAAFSAKNEAKKIIQETFGGLALILGSWIIVATIFSGTDMVKDGVLNINLNIPKITTSPNNNPPGTGGTGTAMTADQLAADKKVRDSLPAGVSAYAGPCTQGQTVGCVNLNGLLPTVVSKLKALHDACGCNISITGGTEGGHSSHSGGNAVDITANYQIKNAVVGNATPKACGVYSGSGSYSGRYLWEPVGSKCGGAYPSSGDHWHISY